MNLTAFFHKIIGDDVRMAQVFMLCRQSGVILSSIVLARTLSSAEVGLFEMLVLCGYLMTFFWSDAFLKGYLANPAGIMQKQSGSSFLYFFMLASFVSMGLLLLGQSWILPILVGRPAIAALGVFALYQALVIPIWVAPFVGVVKGKASVFLATYVLAGPSIACWVGFQTGAGLHGVITGLAVYALLGLVWLVSKTKIIDKINVVTLVQNLWPVTWPLAMYAVSSGLARSFDLWLVARSFDDSTFAFFRYGAREFPVVLAFAAGLSTMMIPRLKTNEALVELRERSTRLMHLSYPLVALIMLISPVLFEFFFGSDYKSGAIIFNVYLLLTLTQLFFPQSVLIAREKTKALWYVSIAELIINVVASVILLHYFGLIGIAFGTLIAFFAEKIILLVLLRIRYGIYPTQLMNLYIWLTYAVVLIVSFILSQWWIGG